MTVKEMAKKYYPNLWSLARLEALRDAGKLTQADVNEIIAGKEES